MANKKLHSKSVWLHGWVVVYELSGSSSVAVIKDENLAKFLA